MTNFEKIKNLSVEEMAKVIHRSADDVCFNVCIKNSGDEFKCPHGEKIDASQCIECMKKWLLEEVC